jgi:hypothetical protein
MPIHAEVVAAEVAPFLSWLLNSSLVTGCFPQHFKEAFANPVLKESNLDSVDACSYRPVSNMSMVSKMLERVVAGQLVSCLLIHDLLPVSRGSEWAIQLRRLFCAYCQICYKRPMVVNVAFRSC